MKDWDEYEVKDMEPLSLYGKHQELIEEIHNTPLTSEARKQALQEAYGRAMAWYKEANKPYQAALDAKAAEFWQDARADLGYTEWLTSEGVAVLESAAWAGHSSGWSGIYNELCKLVDFAREIGKHVKK